MNKSDERVQPDAEEESDYDSDESLVEQYANINIADDESSLGNRTSFDAVSKELNAYKNRLFTKAEVKLHPLVFWSTHEETFPILRMVAKKVFGIPNSSGVTENDVGCAGRMRTNARTRLKGTHVDQAQVISRNQDLIRLDQVPCLSPKDLSERLPKNPEISRELSTGVGYYQSWFSDLGLQFPLGLNEVTEEYFEDLMNASSDDDDNDN